MLTRTLAHTRAHARTRTDTDTGTHAHTRAHRHTHPRAQTRTRMRTRTGLVEDAHAEVEGGADLLLLEHPLVPVPQQDVLGPDFCYNIYIYIYVIYVLYYHPLVPVPQQDVLGPDYCGVRVCVCVCVCARARACIIIPLSRPIAGCTWTCTARIACYVCTYNHYFFVILFPPVPVPQQDLLGPAQPA